MDELKKELEKYQKGLQVGREQELNLHNNNLRLEGVMLYLQEEIKKLEEKKDG